MEEHQHHEVTFALYVISYIVKLTMPNIVRLVHTYTTPMQPHSSGKAVYHKRNYEH